MFVGSANDLAEWCETISASVFSNVTMWVCFATHYRLLKFMWNSLYHFTSLHPKAITNGQWARERGARRRCLIICLFKRNNESDHSTVVFSVVLSNFPWWPFFLLHVYIPNLWNQSYMESCTSPTFCATYRSLSVTYFPYIADSWSAQPPSTCCFGECPSMAFNWEHWLTHYVVQLF